MPKNNSGIKTIAKEAAVVSIMSSGPRDEAEASAFLSGAKVTKGDQKKAPPDDGGANGTSYVRDILAPTKTIADLSEQGFQLTAQDLGRHQNHQADAGRNQTIFDRRGAGYVLLERMEFFLNRYIEFQHVHLSFKL